MAGRHQRPGSQIGVVLAVLAAAALVLAIVVALRPDPAAVTTSTTTVLAIPSTTAAPTTTEPAATSTSSTTTTLADPLQALAMAGDGIGDFGFGTEPDAVINQLRSVLGAPDEDTGWTDVLTTCPGSQARIVRWSSLQLYFTDGETSWGNGPHFFHYGQSLTAGGGEYLELRTDEGIGIGSTLGELRVVYGEGLTVGDDPAFGPYWEVTGEAPAYLWGTASGIDDAGVVDSINGGNGCGV